MKLTRDKKIEYSRMLVSKVKNSGVPMRPTTSVPHITLNKKEKSVDVVQEFEMMSDELMKYNTLITLGFKDINFNHSKKEVKVKYTFSYQ